MTKQYRISPLSISKEQYDYLTTWWKARRDEGDMAASMAQWVRTAIAEKIARESGELDHPDPDRSS